MDGCDPYLILGTKTRKVLTDAEPVDFLSQFLVLDTPVALGDLAIPLVTIFNFLSCQLNFLSNS